MESRQAIQEIIESSNRNSKKYYFIFWLFFLVITGITLSVFLYRFTQEKELWPTLVIFLFPLGTVLFVWLLSIIPFRNYTFFRALVLYNFTNKGFHSEFHLLKMILRASSSFLFCIISITSGFFIAYHTYPGQFSSSSFGLLSIYFSMVFFFIYGVVALPRMISFKTGKNNNLYFYWLQFIRSIMVNSPINMYFSLLLFFLISLFIIFLTNTSFMNVGTEIESQSFDIKYLLDVNMYGVIVTTVGVWLATIIILINDFLKNYVRLYKCYEEYTTHILREQIIQTRYIRFILIGLGNLGRIVGGYIAAQILHQQKEKFSRKPLALFECFVDRNFDIRVIPRSFVVIEQNQSLFEETRFDQNSGLIYGFVNGKDLTNEKGEGTTLPSDLAVFAINGDGGYLPVLELADFSRSKVIINTTSDPDMGLKLKMLVDREIRDIAKPVIITTVEDSGTYSFLEGNNDVTIFPLHAGITEGNSIATRLFSLLLKTIGNDENKLSQLNLYIAGSGKTIYYTLYLFSQLFKKVFNENLLKQILEKQIIIVTDDEELLSESFPTPCNLNSKNPFSQRYVWNVRLGEKENNKIQIVFHDPSKFYALNNAINWRKEFFENDDNAFLNSEHIFLFSTKNAHDAIRICQHIRQIAEINKLASAGVLASVSMEIKNEIEKLLLEFSQLKHFLLKTKGFPTQIKDVILKKNLIVGSQIISISDCLRNRDYYDDRAKFKRFEQPKSNESIVGEMAFCLDDTPGAFCRILTRLAGLSEPIMTKRVEYFPMFFNNYTFSSHFKRENLKNVFVFRGDAYLREVKPNDFNHLNISGYSLNGSITFRNEAHRLINDVFKDVYKQKKTCDFNTRCPVSNNCGTHSENNNAGKVAEVGNNFATIKILADFDDIQGALAIMLADFLRVGKTMTFLNGKPNGGFLDVVYENCVSCDSNGKTVSRLYVNHRQDTDEFPRKKSSGQIKKSDSIDIEAKKNELLNRRNILGLKIKPTRYLDSKWQEYAISLKKYLENVGQRTYNLEESDGDIILYDKEAESEVMAYIRDML